MIDLMVHRLKSSLDKTLCLILTWCLYFIVTRDSNTDSYLSSRNFWRGSIKQQTALQAASDLKKPIFEGETQTDQMQCLYENTYLLIKLTFWCKFTINFRRHLLLYRGSHLSGPKLGSYLLDILLCIRNHHLMMCFLMLTLAEIFADRWFAF